ncbi:response regulator [Lacticaseibacillus saniviri]
MTTIYLAEDQGMLNTALATLLDLEIDLSVVGTATNGGTALEDIRRLNPDVGILDIEMPQMTGLEVASRLVQVDISTKVIILTTFACKSYFQQAAAATVNGYLLKDGPSDALVQAIHSVMAGDTVYAPELVRSVLSGSENPLTPREQEIMIYLRQGLNTKRIAQTVFLSEGTVRNYISAILSKTGSHSRIEAINTAEANGWLDV